MLLLFLILAGWLLLNFFLKKVLFWGIIFSLFVIASYFLIFGGSVFWNYFYLTVYEPQGLRAPIVEDYQFPFSTEGGERNYKISPKYKGFYHIYIRFDEGDGIPHTYNFQGDFKIEISSSDKVLLSSIVNRKSSVTPIYFSNKKSKGIKQLYSSDFEYPPKEQSADFNFRFIVRKVDSEIIKHKSARLLVQYGFSI